MTQKIRRFMIFGEPASKANSRRIVRQGNRVASIKSDKALAYEHSAVLQLNQQCRHRAFSTILRPVGVKIDIFYASNRPDLDESLILDVMQKAGVYKNDRQVKYKCIIHNIDKVLPRSVIEVWEL